MNQEKDVTLGIQLEFRGLTGFLNSDGTLNTENPEFQKYLATVLAAINYAHDCCNYSRTAVDVIAMSNPDQLGATIYEWQDKAGIRRSYTGDSGYVVTTAKTVPHRSGDGRVQSSIVMNAVLLGNLVDVVDAQTPFEEWDPDKQLCLYIVAHELGHAHDNALRHHLSEDQIDLQNEENCTAISRHYAGVLTSEFLACFYSSSVVTEKLQNSMIDDWHSQSEQMIQSVLSTKLSFCGERLFIRCAQPLV